MWASHFVRNGNKLSISSWLATEVQVCRNVGQTESSAPEPCFIYINHVSLLKSRSKTKNRKLAKELLREGKVKEARECFQRCIEVSSHMARKVLLKCREMGVDTIGEIMSYFDSSLNFFLYYQFLYIYFFNGSILLTIVRTLNLMYRHESGYHR